jgi:Glycosyl hydrolase family 76
MAMSMATVSSARAALSPQQQDYLRLAEQGIAAARQAWGDDSHPLYDPRTHRNAIPYHWFDETLACHSASARRTRACKYPLATVWGLIPLWESVDAVAIADPSASNRKAVKTFATNARRYWDEAMRGYAPYPGDRGLVNTWFDDNGWWGLGFVDAFRAVPNCTYARWAQQAFDFVVSRGWDRVNGGFWWNSAHTPNGQKSGEPLAAVSLLGAELAQIYASGACKGDPTADQRTVEKFLAWGDQHFASQGQYPGLYWRTADDPTPTPYIAGPVVEAKELLCRLDGRASPYCGQATQLAAAAMSRFEDRLNMGPQFDTIYLHWMMVYARQAGDSSWGALAQRMATNALANARDSSGLFLRAWDGSDMSAHQAAPGMLRTDAATVELLAWLAVDGPAR